MSKAVAMGRLIFGKPSLSRIWCDECQEETLHRYDRCIHCRTRHREAQWSRRRYFTDRTVA